MRALPAVVLAASLALAAPAAAQDAVNVRYVPSYPPPDRSSEVVRLSVSRIAAATPGRELDVDRYFAAIRAIVADERLPDRWGSVVPDAAWVELEIVLAGRRHVLASAWGTEGPVLQPNATADDRRVAAAMRKALGLTVDRASRTLNGDDAMMLPIAWKAPWRAVDDPDERDGVQARLEHEIHWRHPLRGRRAKVIGRRIDNDDIVAVVDDGTLVNVHLVWQDDALAWTRRDWPTWYAYGSRDAFVAAMEEDAVDYAKA